MKPSERNELIDALIEGDITEADFLRLEAEMSIDPAARKAYFDRVALTQALTAEATAASAMKAVPKMKPQRLWLSWRPLTAAAAGLVFGLFSATMVFGYGSQLKVRIQTLLLESFEEAQMPLGRGVPRRVEMWSGDLLSVESGAVKAAAGQRMVVLPPVPKKKFSYAFRSLDLTRIAPLGATETQQIEVTARFHAAKKAMRDRYQIRLAAFAEDAEGAREIWVGDLINEMALMHVVKTVKMEPDAEGWVTVRSLIDVPAEARVLLVSLAAGLPGDPKKNSAPEAAHYLDDVQVRLITQESLP